MLCISFSVVPCQPSPCINNGTCIVVNATDQEQYKCNCMGLYFDIFCEDSDKVCVYNYRQVLNIIT